MRLSLNKPAAERGELFGARREKKSGFFVVVEKNGGIKSYQGEKALCKREDAPRSGGEQIGSRGGKCLPPTSTLAPGWSREPQEKERWG